MTPPEKEFELNKLKADAVCCLAYDPETGLFLRLGQHQGKVGWYAGWPNGDGYLQIKVCGKAIRTHRLAWLLHYGEWPTGQIDHINRIRSDNRIFNLRDVPPEVNSKNQSLVKTNTSGYQNVSWDSQKKKWSVQVPQNRKTVSLGLFADKEEAAQVAAEYRKANGYSLVVSSGDAP